MNQSVQEHLTCSYGLLKIESEMAARHNLATLPAKLKEYVEVERQSCLILDENHDEFSVVRQLHLWMSLKHEPDSTKKLKLSPLGPVTKEGVEYEETDLIQRLRPQKCTECGKVCTSVRRLNSHKQRHQIERPHQCQQCQQCPKSWKTSWELDQHMMVHTDDRPRRCEVPRCESYPSVRVSSRPVRS